ncbi:MAG: 50S ribosomal protein L3 [bacterium]
MDQKELGLLGKKLGMTQIFDDKGLVVAVTAILIAENVITEVKTKEKHGYSSVQLAAFKTKEKALNKPTLGQFKTKNLDAFRKLTEVRTSEDASDLKVGDEVNAEEFFKDLEKVDITGTSVGKGFQGFVKAHNGRIGRKSHGSKSKRQIGSLGAGTTPGRVLPGKRMPTMLGNETVTTQKVKVVSYSPETKVLLVKGPVPGKPGAQLKIKAYGIKAWNFKNKALAAK